MKFSKKISSRLQDRRGESLTETLVSVLIIALGLTLLASMEVHDVKGGFQIT